MKQIPILDLKAEYEFMKAEIDERLRQCLEHQKWILGPEVKELESAIAGYLQVGNCVGTASGTDALTICLRALAIKLKQKEFFDPAEQIITTPFTFTATGDAILRAGATPVFVDIEPDTFNIDADKIGQYLDNCDSDKVVGIIPVHLYGQSCDMDRIMEIANQYNLFVVEDVAQAFGGKWHDKKLGAIADAGIFSFFPSKNLGGFGDGGMIAANDSEIADIAAMLLKHGGKSKYNVEHIGYNSRLDTIQAAILLAKLKYTDQFNNNRRKIAKNYSAQLSSVSGLTAPAELADAYHVYHQYTVKIADNKRDTVKDLLTQRGVSTAIYYSLPLHKMKVFDGRAIIAGQLNEAEKVAQQVLSLPIEPLLDESQQMFVCDSLKEVLS